MERLSPNDTGIQSTLHFQSDCWDGEFGIPPSPPFTLLGWNSSRHLRERASQVQHELCEHSRAALIFPAEKEKRSKKSGFFAWKCGVWQRGPWSIVAVMHRARAHFFSFFGESEVRVVCSVPWCSELWALGIGESSEVKDLHEKKNQKTRQGIASTGKQSKVAHYLIGKLFWFIFPNAFVSPPHWELVPNSSSAVAANGGKGAHS